MQAAVSDKVAGRLRQAAARMEGKLAYLRRPMTQNPTPKRLKEYNGRLYDARNLERTRDACLALAAAREEGRCPEILAGLTAVKEISPLVTKGLKGAGYYEVIEADEFYRNDPAAVALRELVTRAQTPEGRGEAAERRRRDKVKELEDRLRFAPIEGFFATPPSVVQRMIALADLRPGQRVLEPSAGHGAILDELRGLAFADAMTVTCCEIVPALREILQLKGHLLAGSDFLEFPPPPAADRVLMNPPFEDGKDIEHVRYAYAGLKPGGKLVAVMSSGPFFRSDRKSVEFRAWLESLGGLAAHERLPDGWCSGPDAFKRTATAGVLLVIDRPASNGTAGP